MVYKLERDDSLIYIVTTNEKAFKRRVRRWCFPCHKFYQRAFVKKIAIKYNVIQQCIYNMLKGRTWADV